MRNAGKKLVLLVALLIGAAPSSVPAQTAKKRQTAKQATPALKDQRQEAIERSAKLREELVEASRAYRQSLEQLLVYRERGVTQAAEQLGKLKELYDLGLVSKKQIQDGEASLVEARARVDETRQQMQTSEALIAQTLEESRLAEQLAKTPPLPPGGMVRTVAFIRYTGSVNWSVANAGAVQNFFQGKFGRLLPVSAFGQTALHNQLGFDHRHAMDVAVHPDSAEGQALLNYLRQAGISFIAFRQAVAGTATGPHIHIGRPSHRIARP